MAGFVATLALTFVIISAVVLLLSKVRTPRYRLQRENVKTLLRMVLDGVASANDWNVFVGIPIRHDPELERIRLACAELEKHEFTGGGSARGERRYLLTRKGLARIRELLAALEDEGGR